MDVWSWPVSPWLKVPLVFLVWVLVLAAVKKSVFALVRKLTEKTKSKLDDVLIDALDFPIQVIVVASGILAVQHMIPRGEGPDLLRYLLGGFKVACIVAVVLFVDKFLRGLIAEAGDRIEILKTSGGFVRGFVRAAVFGLGTLVLLDTFGVSITPIIASLGIGSLAVALALQPTLENFFSGIQLIIDKPIQVGQMIRLESGEEGIVQRIGWRSTWITMGNNNTVVLPNKTLVNSRVTNYFFPNPEIAVSVAVEVHYASDLEKVEAVTIEAGREAQLAVPGAVRAFEPVVRFQAFEESGISLNVVLRAGDFSSSHLLRHDFIKRLQQRYAREGIVMPFPTRTVIQEQSMEN